MKNPKMLLPSVKAHVVQISACAMTVFESVLLIVGLFENKNGIGSHIPADRFLPFLCYTFIALLALLGLINEIWGTCSDYKKDCGRIFLDDDKTGIDAYLTDFIEKGESVAILTHDMSWINDNNFSMLEQKARRRELLLFLPQETEKVSRLKELGADVRCYGSMISDPAHAQIKSRMTVVNWNKAFPKLTYPIKKDGLHINYEIPAGEPANQLALDLIQLLILSSHESQKETTR